MPAVTTLDQIKSLMKSGDDVGAETKILSIMRI